MNNLLAIIIPAYKGEYLDKTLNSLSRQTDQRFTLYIGDDNSPYPLKDIIDQYSNQLDIVYHRFDNNLGHTNLIHHWERCIEMMNNEPYFCMFSDDDLMDPIVCFVLLSNIRQRNRLRCVPFQYRPDKCGRQNHQTLYSISFMDIIRRFSSQIIYLSN